MDAAELVRQLARGGRTMELHGAGQRVFRVWHEHDTTLIKVYASPGSARREKRAFEVLGGVLNMPEIAESGSVDDVHWVRFVDPGHWTAATLPHNYDAAEQAGAIIRSLQKLDASDLSNLSTGIVAAKVASDFVSVFERLERYRGRLELPRSAIDAALASSPPPASDPVPSHTSPRPEKFFIARDGKVTLFDWVWATPAPPEWDASLAWWTFLRSGGEQAAAAFERGFANPITHEATRSWIIYHLGTHLLRNAEDRSGRLESLAGDVRELLDLLGL